MAASGWGKLDNLGSASVRKVLTNNTTYKKVSAKDLVAGTQIVQKAVGWGKFNNLDSASVPKQVKSTNINSYTYDKQTRKLTVNFVKGINYVYFNVPQSKVSGLDKAPSKGKYFEKNIRFSYQYKRM